MSTLVHIGFIAEGKPHDPNSRVIHTCGKTESTFEKLNVNKTANGYGLWFTLNSRITNNMMSLATNIKDAFEVNLPNEDITFEGVETGDHNVEAAVSDLIMHLNMITEVNMSLVNLDVVDDTVDNKIILSRPGEMNKNKRAYDFEDVDDTDLDDEDEYDDGTMEVYNEIFEMLGIDPNSEDYDESSNAMNAWGMEIPNDKIKNKKKHSTALASKILKDSKNPRRDISRHGVIIYDGKRAKEKDKKIIYQFLKEFIPGDASWKKKFRRDLLKRWMAMYSISKKDIRKLEKHHSKSKTNKNISKSMKLAKSLYKTNPWSDPNK